MPTALNADALDQSRAWRSERSLTCRRSRPWARNSTGAPICFLWASFCTKCPRDGRRFPVPPAPRYSMRFSIALPFRLCNSIRNFRRSCEEILDKALEKDLKLRYQTASDFRVDLQRLRRSRNRMRAQASRRSLTRRCDSAVSSSAPASRGRVHRGWRCGIVAIALIAGAYVLGKREGLASSITPPTYHQLTFRGGTIRMARFAPDGKNIVYSAAWEGNPIELLVTRPDSPESRPFGLSKAEVLSISSEGEMAVLLNSHNVDPYINEGRWAECRWAAALRARCWRMCSGLTGRRMAPTSPWCASLAD